MQRHRRIGRPAVIVAIATALAGLLSLAGTDAVADDSGAFVMTTSRDTLALEAFRRTGDYIEGALLFRLGGLRFDYGLLIAPSGAVGRMENAVRAASASPDSRPSQTASIEWRGDSVFADVKPGGLQRIASRPGSMPYLNPSLLMLECLVQRSRARQPPLDTVPVFLVSGGRTLPAVVRGAGADSLVVSLAGSSIELRVDRAGRILAGSVPSQGLRFVRVASLPGHMLSMAPPDYSAPAGAPYRAESVHVRTRGGFELAGTLTRPDGPGRAPCVLTITGSGPEDRDEAIPLVKGYRPFRQIADTLARRGIAVLRLDDRGTGESGGRFSGSTSADFSDDVADALHWLQRDPGIDPARLALLGHSEGGLIAPLVALREPSVRALVLLAAPAWEGRRILAYQQDQAARKTLAGAALDSAKAAGRRDMDSLAVADPWYGFFVGYDPLPVARKLSRPAVLLLQGETDRQVTAEQAAELESAFHAAGNRDVTLHVFPATNHLFLPDSSGDPAAYISLPSGEVPRATLGIVADWLAARLSPPGRRSR